MYAWSLASGLLSATEREKGFDQFIILGYNPLLREVRATIQVRTWSRTLKGSCLLASLNSVIQPRSTCLLSESQVLLHQSAVKTIPHRHTHGANLQRPWLIWHYSPPARGFWAESSWQVTMTPTKRRRHPVRLRGSWDQASHYLSELSLMSLRGPFMWDRNISWTKALHMGDTGACGSSLIWDLLTFSIDFNNVVFLKDPAKWNNDEKLSLTMSQWGKSIHIDMLLCFSLTII